MQPVKQSVKTNDAFELKGSLFTLTVLYLLQTDINSINSQLKRITAKTPQLFKNMPIVIDLEKVRHADQSINFIELTDQLRNYGFTPVGVRNGHANHIQAAAAAQLGILPESKAKANKPNTNAPLSQTHIVSKPIRSGQQVYAKDANLVVLANVSQGAELLADGCIHVYSTLRGRALAGIKGDNSARIFCLSLDAELVSIAGHYKLQENIKVPDNSSAIQIYLEDDQLHIEPVASKIAHS